MRWRAPLLLAALLGLPLPSRAQGLAPLRVHGLRCVQGAHAPASCKPFLDTTYRLKNRAEAAKRWRCYSALLGYEAQVIAARGGGAGDTPAATASELALDSAYGELSAECEPIQ